MNLVDIDVSFEGKSKRQELDAVLAMVKNLVEKNRAGWDCPLEGPISQCEAVKHWTELATALPFSETDVILGGHHFHLPAPKQFVPPPKDMVSEDVVSGVNRATMQLELDLPHSTFMNVDDDAVDYEAAMIVKQKAVIASRKRAAEKLLANSASGKRALVASKQGNVSGHARGYGARQTSSNAQGDPNDGENAEKDDVVEDKGKDGESDKDESQDDDEVSQEQSSILQLLPHFLPPFDLLLLLYHRVPPDHLVSPDVPHRCVDVSWNRRGPLRPPPSLPPRFRNPGFF